MVASSLAEFIPQISSSLRLLVLCLVCPNLFVLHYCLCFQRSHFFHWLSRQMPHQRFQCFDSVSYKFVVDWNCKMSRQNYPLCNSHVSNMAASSSSNGQSNCKKNGGYPPTFRPQQESPAEYVNWLKTFFSCSRAFSSRYNLVHQPYRNPSVSPARCIRTPSNTSYESFLGQTLK